MNDILTSQLAFTGLTSFISSDHGSTKHARVKTYTNTNLLVATSPNSQIITTRSSTDDRLQQLWT